MRRCGFVLLAVVAVACLGCAQNSASVDPQMAKRLSGAGFTFIGMNTQGCEEYRHETTGMVFIRLPGGAYKMGSENGDPNESPVHEVEVDGFLVGKFEVTQAVWEKVMGYNPSDDANPDHAAEPADGKTDDHAVKPAHDGKGDHPVVQVSWEDCQAFCDKAGLRLPTEAEWEYACRGGTDTDFFWGDEFYYDDYVWCNLNAGDKTNPVGQKKPNGYGLYDMNGNVCEQVQDYFDPEYYKSSPRMNPQGPEDGDKRAVRSGGWSVGLEICRPSSRSGHEQWLKCTSLGFRCIYRLK
jgi:sulfatase modifying factor 1